jgi:flavin-binding protein dodecin
VTGAEPGRPAPHEWVGYNTPMTDNVYSISEIVGTSPDGVDHAIRNAITRASRTLRNLDWFEVVEVRGYLSEGAIDHFQVRLKVGFRLEDAADVD